MTDRVKYPLSNNAKVAARELLDYWDSGDINQLFFLMEITSGFGSTDLEYASGLGVYKQINLPKLPLLFELSVFNLIKIDRREESDTLNSSLTIRWEILLLQELRNAVENDFQVSDYFLTVNAVGMVINTDGGNISFEGAYQSGASGVVDVHQIQNIEQLPNELTQILGQDLLQQYTDIHNSIQELQTASQSQKRTKLINTLSILVNHMANGVTLTQFPQAIEVISQALR